MLEVRHLLKRYNRIPAVEDVSFTIRPAKYWAISPEMAQEKHHCKSPDRTHRADPR